MNYNLLKKDLKKILKFKIQHSKVIYKTLESKEKENYTQYLISYEQNDNDTILAYLLIPKKLKEKNPAVLINHQHNAERHLGKSEVCGLIGNPLQAFGPILATNGIIVLAPDSICFEDRRRNKKGIEPDLNDKDYLQHYNEMCYRLLKGELLITKVLNDAALGVSLLFYNPLVDNNKIGTLGHSYGGNTVLFLSALDERLKFSCSSGAVGSYKNKMENGIGMEMSLVIPDFITKYDIDDLIKCIIPRRLLIISAEDDKYSKDADVIYSQIKKKYDKDGFDNIIEHKRYEGEHPLTKERFDYIVEWMINECNS